MKVQIKAPLSLLLSLTLVAAFSFSPFAVSGAAEETAPAAVNLPAFQGATATITIHGPVNVNGNEVKSGATVMNGSVIHARTGGHATIEMGALGRVELEPETTITLNMLENRVEVSLNQCGSVRMILPAGVAGLVKILHRADVGVFSERKEVDVKVYRGQALVKREKDKEETLTAGEREEYDDATEVSATGDVEYKVFCHEDHYVPVPFFFLPLAAFLFDGDDIPPFLSELQPAT